METGLGRSPSDIGPSGAHSKSLSGSRGYGTLSCWAWRASTLGRGSSFLWHWWPFLRWSGRQPYLLLSCRLCEEYARRGQVLDYFTTNKNRITFDRYINRGMKKHKILRPIYRFPRRQAQTWHHLLQRSIVLPWGAPEGVCAQVLENNRDMGLSWVLKHLLFQCGFLLHETLVEEELNWSEVDTKLSESYIYHSENKRVLTYLGYKSLGSTPQTLQICRVSSVSLPCSLKRTASPVLFPLTFFAASVKKGHTDKLRGDDSIARGDGTIVRQRVTDLTYSYS